MKKFALSFLALAMTVFASSQIRMTMVDPANHEIQVTNFGMMSVNISTYRLCALFDYQTLNQAPVSIVSGDFNLSPNESVTFSWDNQGGAGFLTTESDLGLYLPNGSFGSAANMVDFMQYGASGLGRESVAIAGGRWTAGDFLETSTGPWIYVGNGTQNGMMFWSAMTIAGCTDATACNYNGSATEDDGSCTYPGCPIQFACNYNPNAACSDEAVCNGTPGSSCDDGDPLTSGETFDNNCNCVAPASNSIFDIVAASNVHNTLESALLNSGLSSTLSGPGTYTLFAPTDEAFDALPAGTIDALLLDPSGVLTQILLYHTVGAEALSSVLEDGMTITTLQGQDVLVTINADGIFINNAQVIIADIIADNGVVHVINAVLTPEPPTQNTIFDIIANSPEHSTLESAILAAQLENVLQSPGTYTAFAPTDAAFEALPPGLLDALLNDPNGALTAVLIYHAIDSVITFNGLSDGASLTTMVGEDITITVNPIGTFVNDALITIADINASNGVVHVIDAVLLPTSNETVSIFDIVDASTNHTTLQIALEAAGLDVVLSEPGNYTLFAPTNSAFEALPAGTIDALLADTTGALNNILFYHTVGTTALSTDLSNSMTITTLQGQDIIVNINDQGVFVNNAQVILADLIANNGVVHVIDAVLLPTADLVPGCTDITACNFNISAEVDDNSCTYPSCTNPEACNYDALALCSDESLCDLSSGCTNPEACNFDIAATCDNGLCLFPSINEISLTIDESGFVTYNDTILGPGVFIFTFNGSNGCDSIVNVIVIDLSTSGCLDPTACNYVPTAGISDSASCVLPACKDILACNYDSISTCDGGICYYTSCNDPAACNFDANAFCGSPGVCEYANEVYNCSGQCNSDVDADGVCDQLEVVGCNDPLACNYIPASTEAGVCSYPSEIYLDCAGNCLSDNNNNAICDEIELEGCTDPSACNYNPDANIENLTCLYPGCTDPLACNYDENASCSDNSCELSGCTNSNACNFNALAACDNGDCIFPGCTDITACNFDFTAGCDDNTCTYSGCMNTEACNYSASAACDDNSCVFGGCTESSACNFNPSAGCEDGSCEFPGCNDETACNFDPNVVCGDNSCIYLSEQSILDCAGNCINDVNIDGVCDEYEGTFCSDSTACNFSLTGLDTLCFYPGCTDPLSCNYNASASCDNGSCSYPGCTEIAACNYDASAACEDGTCEFPACTAPEACNFDFYATCDDGSCQFPGCTDPSACNYDPTAACDGGICLSSGCTDITACNFDETASCDDGSCSYPGCSEPSACNFNQAAGCDDGSCSFNSSDVITIEASQDEINNGIIFAGETLTSQGEYEFNLVSAAGCDSVITLIIINTDLAGCLVEGACNYEEFAGINIDSLCVYPGCNIIGSCNYDSTAGCNDGSCIASSCTDPSACNFEANFVCSDNSICLFGLSGCTNPEACNYDTLAVCDDNSCILASVIFDCEGNCNFDTDNDGVCDQLEIVGCQDIAACNYDINSTDEGICIYPSNFADCNGNCINDINNNNICDETEQAGCTDMSACNYNASATIEDGNCLYPAADYLDCNGACLLDADNDGICNLFDSVGCTNSAACNYNSFAITDDASCIFPGCTDTAACNFDASVGCDNGTCIYSGFIYNCEGLCFNDNDGDGVCNEFEIVGCIDTLSCNFNASATDEGICEYPAPFRDCAGNCLADNDNDGVCNEEEVIGCYDAEACNYEPLASDSGACEYATLYLDCSGNCLQDADADGICDQLEIAGCIDSVACNFNASVDSSDNSCVYPGCMILEACNYDALAGCNVDSLCSFPEMYYDCAGACISDADQDGTCDAYDTTGCISMGACNYNPFALFSDSTCVYPGCMILGACNYDPTAPCNVDSLCIIPEQGYDCTGSCIADADNDGVCDAFETTGCTDPTACNYNEFVTDDDGSCSFNSEVTVDVTIDQSEYPNGYVWQGEVFTSSGSYLYIIPNDAGCDSLITLNLTITVGINEIISSQWNLWPNPARDYINVTGNNTIDYLTILDVTGKVILTQKYSGSIDITDFSSGVYIMQIKSSNGIEIKRFEVSR